MSRRKIILACFTWVLCLVHSISSQEIVTASVFFDSLSESYRTIEDYQATLLILQEESVTMGTLFHKRPNFLLIEFEDPADQVIAVDGEKLIIYIPFLNVALEQQLQKADENIATLATAPGLDLMKSRYSVAYQDSQDLVPLEEESEELVWKLVLEWQSIDEGFRQLILSVNEDLLIRRIVGVTSSFEEIQLDFLDILLNQGLPEGKFRYESPSSANVIKDFIFEPEEE